MSLHRHAKLTQIIACIIVRETRVYTFNNGISSIFFSYFKINFNFKMEYRLFRSLLGIQLGLFNLCFSNTNCICAVFLSVV